MIIAIALSALSIAISAWSIYRTHRARKAVRELTSQPSPGISFPGTLTPEAEAKLAAKLSEGIERLHRKGRAPW